MTKNIQNYIIENLLIYMKNKLIKQDQDGTEIFQIEESIFKGIDFNNFACSCKK
jgi:hypothetical protein